MARKSSNAHVWGALLAAVVFGLIIRNQTMTSPEGRRGEGSGSNHREGRRNQSDGSEQDSGNPGPIKTGGRSIQDPNRIGFTDAAIAIQSGDVSVSRAKQLILRFDDFLLRRSLTDLFFGSPKYSASDKIQLADELSNECYDVVTGPIYELFGKICKDPEVGWQKTMELVALISIPALRDMAYQTAYTERYSESKNYKELISEESVNLIGTFRNSEVSRARFLRDVLDSIYRRSGSDTSHFDHFIEAVDDFDGSEKFKLVLLYEIRRSKPTEFERWSSQAGKYQDLTIEKLKELYKK